MVHNGIIENYRALQGPARASRGHVFRLRDRHRGARPPDRRLLRRATWSRAVQRALREVEGTYGIAVIRADEPDQIVGARNGSPLVVGVGDGENFVASRRGGHHRPHPPGRSTWTTARWSRSRPEDVHTTTTIDNERDHQGDRRRSPGTSTRSRRAATTTSCSRRSSSSRRPMRNAFRGRILPDDGRRQAGRPPADRLGAAQHPAHRHPGLRHLLARRPGRRVPARGARPHPGRGRVRHRVPLPRPIIEPGTLCLVISQSRRDRRHPRGHARGASARAPWSWASSTWSARPSPARPTAASTSTPARRSASPRPRPSPARSRCWRC